MSNTVYMAKPPKPVSEMTEEELREWCTEVHAKMVTAEAIKE